MNKREELKVRYNIWMLVNIGRLLYVIVLYHHVMFYIHLWWHDLTNNKHPKMVYHKNRGFEATREIYQLKCWFDEMCEKHPL
jgi:hypothetical protein